MAPCPAVILVRHGCTALDAKGCLSGRINVGLDATGRDEAAALGSDLAVSRMAGIVTSPMKCAIETADAVAALHPGVRVEEDARLLERDCGQWAGRPRAELLAAYPDEDSAPDVEPRAAFDERVFRAFARAAERAIVAESVVVLVTHDAVIRTILTTVIGLQPKGGWRQQTGCWSRVERASEGGWVATVVDCKPTTRPFTIAP